MATINRAVIIHAGRHHNHDTLGLLEEQEQSLELQLICEAIWQGDCRQMKDLSTVLHQFAEL
jgi:hypothetical protein